jgi:hypothetical protein
MTYRSFAIMSWASDTIDRGRHIAVTDNKPRFRYSGFNSANEMCQARSHEEISTSFSVNIRPSMKDEFICQLNSFV